MSELFAAPSIGVFIASIGVTFLLCVVEGLALAFAGTTTPSFLDYDDVENPASGPLNYLNAGHLPLTLFVASAAAMFGIAGLGLQQGAHALTGETLSLMIAVPVAVIAAIPSTHLLSRGLGSLLPKTETSAVSNEALVGLTGVVMAGTGTRGLPVQVRVKDHHGQSHYLQVEPVRDDDTLTQGQPVQIIRREGACYFAIASASLFSQES